LNLAIVQVVPNYAPALAVYSQVLSQRNALLKQLSERQSDPLSSNAQLRYWDEQLVGVGAQIMHARIHALQELERRAAQTHRELTDSQEILRLVYQPSFEPLPARSGQYVLPLSTAVDRTGLSIEKIQQAFVEGLARIRGDEIARGVTTIGPHRDEVRFLGNGIDLGIYGSRGQARTAMLALKLAEMDWMKEKTGQWPVLLLDEVLAELDPTRRTDLLARLMECEQTFLTTTDLDLFSADFIDRATIWNVKEGQIIEAKP
jgi:DNA replication and repair protein RecF